MCYRLFLFCRFRALPATSAAGGERYRRGRLEEVYFGSGCNERVYVLIMPSQRAGVSWVRRGEETGGKSAW